MSARALRRLNVMHFRAAYNLPITLGLEHGVFARHGLDLEITYTRGSRMSGASLVSGAQDWAPWRWMMSFTRWKSATPTSSRSWGTTPAPSS